MKVAVGTKIVHGTERGGEDLFLTFDTANENPVSEAEVELDLNQEAFQGEEDNPGQKTLKTFTTEYDFSWEGTKEDLLAILKKALKDDENWSLKRGKQVWEFHHEHFVAGNAD